MFWRKQSFDVLPALSVRRRELRKSLRLVTLSWMFGVVWLSCISGSQVTVFARMLGFTDLDFGIMAAIPFYATFGQVIATVLIERSGLRKFQFLYFNALHRMLFMVIAIIPVFLPPGRLSSAMMLVVLAISWFAAAMAAPAWWTWMGDLIPKRVRGRFFANRDRLASLVQVLVVILIGIMLDMSTIKGVAGPETPATQPRLLVVTCVIYAIAGIFGTLDIMMFRSIRELVPKRSSDYSSGLEVGLAHKTRTGFFKPFKYALGVVRSVVIDPLKDKAFRYFVGHGATIMFLITISQWFVWLHVLEGLHFSKVGANVVLLVLGPLVRILAARPWGKLIDRWGPKPVLLLGTIGATLSYVPWLFTPQDMVGPAYLVNAVNRMASMVGGLFGHPGLTLAGADTPVGGYLLITIASCLGGATWISIILSQTSLLMGFSDSGGRSKFVASWAVLTSIGGAIGGTVGGWIADSLSFLRLEPLRIGPLAWNNWHFTFLGSVLAGIIAMIWLAGMPASGGAQVRQVFRELRMVLQNTFAAVVHLPLRMLHIRGRHDDSSGR